MNYTVEKHFRYGIIIHIMKLAEIDYFCWKFFFLPKHEKIALSTIFYFFFTIEPINEVCFHFYTVNTLQLTLHIHVLTIKTSNDYLVMRLSKKSFLNIHVWTTFPVKYYR